MIRLASSEPVTHVALRVDRVTLVLRRGQRISTGEIVELVACWRRTASVGANDVG